MTAIQLLEKLGAQKDFDTTQLSNKELCNITNLVQEKAQFISVLTNGVPEELPDDEEPEPEKEKINRLN
jgi:hypothetical protein